MSESPKVIFSFLGIYLGEENSILKDFMNSCNLENVLKKLTCFKSDNPTCIDLILTSDTTRLKNTTTIETGLSDFHVIIATALKQIFCKRGPRIITYRDYDKFNNSVLITELQEELTSNSDGNQDFTNVNRISKKVLDKHATCKKKYV